MEVSIPCDALAHEHVTSVSESVHANVSDKQSLCRIGEGAVVEDVLELMSGCSLGLDNEEFWSREKETNWNQINSSTAASEKVLAKSATFPCSSLGDDDTKSERPAACNRSTSLPSSRKLVSAMKGGRERQVGLTVTWGPDVYDPPATSLSHTVNGYNSQQQRSSKNSKKKKRSRGKSSSSRDKKQQYPRKHTASSNKSQSNNKKINDNDVFHEETESTSEDYLDFSVTTGGLQDCGTSFLRTSAVVDKRHIPFAEAT